MVTYGLEWQLLRGLKDVAQNRYLMDMLPGKKIGLVVDFHFTTNLHAWFKEMEMDKTNHIGTSVTSLESIFLSMHS